MIFLLSAESGVLSDIRHSSICQQAGFILDKPMNIGEREVYFEMLNGQWYTIEWTKDGRNLHPVEGRWTINN